MTDQRIQKWTRWLDGTIKNNVLAMHLQRDAWKQVASMLGERVDLPESYWWEFMVDTYATTQAVAVRRQADTHRDAASLAKLIEEIANDPQRITRAYWLGLWEPTGAIDTRIAERQWKANFAGPDGGSLDPTMPAADGAALQMAAQSVKRYVDQHVAHADASAVAVTVTLTLDDVHDAIEVIGDLFRKYYSLLKASSFMSLVPVIQHDWKAIFREPWQEPRPPIDYSRPIDREA